MHNYDVTWVTGTFTITPREITVTADDKAKTYGEKDPKLTATVTSRHKPAIVPGDTVDYALRRDAGEEWGRYAIRFANPRTEQGGRYGKNYKVTFKNGTLSINTREITVTADSKSKLYGEADPAWTVTYRLDTKGATDPAVAKGDAISYTINRARDVYEGDGGCEYTIPITGAANQAGHAGGNARNYKVNFRTGVLTVRRRAVTVTANDATKTYGSKDPAYTATVRGAIKGETVTYAFGRQRGEHVGTYAVTPKGEAVQGSYTVTYKPGRLTITPKAVTVTPNDLSKTYGSKDPALTAKVAGLVGSDKVAYTLSRDPGEDVGTYAIRATGTAKQGDYTVSFKVGTLTIRPKTVTVSAKSLSKLYGTKDPELKATVKGLLGTDTVKFKLARQTGEDAGEYLVIPTGKATQGNYALKFANGTFTIRRRQVTVTARNAAKHYGERDPELTAKVTGTIKGETVTYKLTRKRGEAVGDYAITPSGKALQGSYEVTYKAGKLTISDVARLTPEYSVHCQKIGWTPVTYDGEFAGTTGQSRRMEALTLKVPDAPYSGSIAYKTYVQKSGWQGWKKDGEISGTWGKALRAEAFQIKLTGELAKHFDVYYRVHVQDLGWMAWAKNGEKSGTAGYSRRAEAIQIVILRKGSKAPKIDYKGVAQMYDQAFIEQ